MFQPEGLGRTIFEERYTRFEGETWDQACFRVAEHVAGAEENSSLRRWTERFYAELIENRFMPGGRIWYGAGRPRAQLLNCYVVPTADSREGWGKTVSHVVVISGTGGGVGINCSPVRPRGSEIKGTGGKATGAVSLMELINKVGDVIVGGGTRRAALMLCLDFNHPDVEEFLDAKLEVDQLNKANVSVVLTRPTEEFQQLVQTSGRFDLFFGGKATGKSLDAEAFWNRLVENAWKSGEPGVLNGFEANRMSNTFYYKPLISTNPCGELWLTEYGCCDLGALVLPRFVRAGQMDWDQLDHTIRAGVRFLDNVLTVNSYPLPETQKESEAIRRIGLGVMGLHSMLLELGYRYSSPDGRKFVSELFGFIKQVAYDTSIHLAVEKGAFPAFDQRLLDSGFAKTLKRGMRAKIREYGLRNCALLTVAPTGTTSIVSGVSSGIEPLFAPAYWRNYRQIDSDARESKARELVVTPEFERFGELAEGAYDLEPKDHFEIQRLVQQHVDNAVSKTINLAKDFPKDELGKVWLEYLPYIKGSTFYREGSREGEPLEYIRVEDVGRVLKENAYKLDFNAEELGSLDCPSGFCEIPRSALLAEEAPAGREMAGVGSAG